MYKIDGRVILNGVYLDDCTPEQMRAELESWGASYDDRLERVLDFIERQSLHLHQENERLWRAIEGSRK